MGKTNNILELNFIGSNSIQPKVDKHKDTVCSNCGSNYASSNWYKTYNRDGSWDKNSYHCAMCHTYFDPNTGKFSKNTKVYKIHENTVCSCCGSNVTSSSWCKTYNKDGSWDSKSYHCNKCHYYFDYNTGKFSGFLKGPDLSNVQELNFVGSDSIQPKVRKVIVEHKDTICSNCGSNSTSSNWRKKRDDNGNWDKTYICMACYSNPACRSGELDPNSNVYKGMIGVQTVAKVLGDKDCTIMKEGSSFDICSIQSIKYGKIEVKIVTYNLIYRHWMVGGIKPGLFDTLFVICTDKKFENVIRIYIIDGIEVGNVSSITVYRNPSKGGWYKEFRADDIVQYQEAFQTVKNENHISKNYIDNGQNSMSTKEKGDLCEEIVEITINAEISTDIRYDLVHDEYKRIEVKGSDYSIRHKYWLISGIESYKFDNLFIVCMSSNFERVERVYIINKEYVGEISGITIYESILRRTWYEEFRVDEKLYQEACEKIMKDDNI